MWNGGNDDGGISYYIQISIINDTNENIKKNIIVLSKIYPFKHALDDKNCIYIFLYLKPRQTNGIPFHPPDNTNNTPDINPSTKKKILLKFFICSFFEVFMFY